MIYARFVWTNRGLKKFLASIPMAKTIEIHRGIFGLRWLVVINNYQQ